MGDLDWGLALALAMAMGTVNCNALHVLAAGLKTTHLQPSVHLPLVKQLLTNFTNETAELLSPPPPPFSWICLLCNLSN